MLPSSMSTHVGVTCGEPSFIRVDTKANLKKFENRFSHSVCIFVHMKIVDNVIIKSINDFERMQRTGKVYYDVVELYD
jgi:hypothetical protein